ncbi:N-acetylmuramoyl-L-alanine amidase [Bacillus sp. IITD106]|nr:N-acetylmuramoyl-L-alanine amidase [Bacillus sp. IITD106]
MKYKFLFCFLILFMSLVFFANLQNAKAANAAVDDTVQHEQKLKNDSFEKQDVNNIDNEETTLQENNLAEPDNGEELGEGNAEAKENEDASINEVDEKAVSEESAKKDVILNNDTEKSNGNIETESEMEVSLEEIEKDAKEIPTQTVDSEKNIQNDNNFVVQDYFILKNSEAIVYDRINGGKIIGKLYRSQSKYKILSKIDNNWISIHYAGTTGFIKITDVTFTDESNFQLPNPGLPVYKNTIHSSSNVAIYAGASKNSEVLGYIQQGQQFSTFGTNGPEFIVVDVGGRLAFVQRKYFQSSDKYITTDEEQTIVYSDTSGKRALGNLNGNNTVYKIDQVLDDIWAIIHFAGSPGYVRIQDVTPKIGGRVETPNPGLIVFKTGLKDDKPLPIYSSASKRSKVIGYLASGQAFKTYGTNGPEFIVIDIGGRLGFVDRLYFAGNDQYFATKKDQTIVYSDASGKRALGNFNGKNVEYKIDQIYNDTWAIIHFAGSTGYVRIQDVTPKKEGKIENSNPGLTIYKTGLKDEKPLPIFSSASVKSEVIGYMASGQTFNTYGTNGPEFIVIDVGGRLGFVKRLYFQSTDQFLTTKKEQTFVYNSKGNTIGKLTGKGNEFKISQIINDNVAVIHYLGQPGYIYSNDVSISNGSNIASVNPGLIVYKTFISPKSLALYDRDNRTKIIGYLNAGQTLKTFGTDGSQFIVGDVGGRLVNILISESQYDPSLKKKIVIDAGHGGKDSGAIGNGFFEKNIALDIAKKVEYYLNTYYLGHEVRLTRSDDTFLELKDRANIANRWGADVFVSIHLNSFDSKTSGYEDYRHSKKTDGVLLQNIMHKHIAPIYSSNGIKDRGEKKADFAVLRETNMPAILTENGFIDNSGDMALIKQEWFRNLIAKAHADGIAEFLGLKRK